MFSTTIAGGGTGETVEICMRDGLCEPRARQSRSPVSDDATAIRFVTLMFGPVSSDVLRKLESTPNVASFLVAAYTSLVPRFEPGAGYRLVLFSDPEAPVTSASLVVEIRTTMPVTDVLRSLANFDRDWYLQQPAAITEQLSFIPEFA